MLAAVTVPFTAREVRVPTDVIFGCAAVVTVPAVVAEPALVALATAPVTLAPAIALRPDPLPVKTPVLAVNATAVTVPLTPRPVSVPRLVMLPCAAVVTVPAVVAAPVNAPTNVVDVTLDKPATVVTVEPKVNAVLPNTTFEFANLACANVPLETLLAFNAVSAEPLPVKIPVFAVILAAVTLPLTASPVKVPTDVIFGCAAVVTVSAVVAAETVPVTLAPVIDEREEPLPLTLVNTPCVAPMLPTLALPVPVFNVPATLTPVPVTTTTLELPATEIPMFPEATGMLIFDVPFASVGPGTAITPVKFEPSPFRNCA